MKRRREEKEERKREKDSIESKREEVELEKGFSSYHQHLIAS